MPYLAALPYVYTLLFDAFCHGGLASDSRHCSCRSCVIVCCRCHMCCCCRVALLWSTAIPTRYLNADQWRNSFDSAIVANFQVYVYVFAHKQGFTGNHILTDLTAQALHCRNLAPAECPMPSSTWELKNQSCMFMRVNNYSPWVGRAPSPGPVAPLPRHRIQI